MNTGSTAPIPLVERLRSVPEGYIAYIKEDGWRPIPVGAFCHEAARIICALLQASHPDKTMEQVLSIGVMSDQKLAAEVRSLAAFKEEVWAALYKAGYAPPSMNAVEGVEMMAAALAAGGAK